MPRSSAARQLSFDELNGPPIAASRLPSVRNAAVAYEAGGMGRRAATWRPPTVSPNDGILQSLSTLRDRSRAAVRNDGYAKGAIDNLVSNFVGDGIKPLSQADTSVVVTMPDGRTMPLRQAVQETWTTWTNESDADELLDFYGQQSQAVRVWLEGGESFTRLRPRLATDGLSVPFQIQILEPELCPHGYNIASADKPIRAGIEFTPIGQRAAYYFHPSRPEIDDYDRSQLRRIPSDSVGHLYEPLRAGQLRGLPRLTQALIRLRDLDSFDDATLLRQQLANLFVAFLKKDAAAGNSDTADVNPLTGKTRGSANPASLGLEPGIFQELEPGEDVTFSNPPGTPTGYIDFVRAQMRSAAVAIGLPYEIWTGDMSGMNDRTVRVVLNQFKRAVAMAQHQIIVHKFCRVVWNAWIDRAFVSGAITFPADYATNRAKYAAVKWTPPRWAYLHPVQDIEADREAIRAGFTSRSSVVSEWGEDAEAVDAEQEADNKRADDAGLKYSSDGRGPVTTPSAASIASQQPANA